MQRLAQELIDAILDNLHPSFPNSLRNCSLVCRRWRPTSQRLLFRCLIIDMTQPVDPVPEYIPASPVPEYIPASERLYQTLLDSPYLVDYIKELELINADEILPLLLPKLHNLESLVIDLWETPWNYLALDVKLALSSALQLPSMRFVEITQAVFDNVNELSRFLYHGRGINCLSLYEISVKEFLTQENEEEGEEGQNIEPRSQSRLNDLQLCSIQGHTLDGLLGNRYPLNVSHIHTLKILEFRKNSGNAINRLLHAIGSSLKFLRIRVPPSDQEGVGLTLNFNLDIQFLHLYMIFQDQFPWILSLLSTFNTSNQLHAVDLVAVVNPESGGWPAWEKMDTILAGASFKFLRKLNLILLGEDDFTTEELDRIGVNVVGRFPLLAERGVLVSPRTIS